MCSTAVQAQELVTYQIPKEMFYSAHNDDFTVKVRVPGGEWNDLYEYKVEVDMDNHERIQVSEHFNVELVEELIFFFPAL